MVKYLRTTPVQMTATKTRLSKLTLASLLMSLDFLILFTFLKNYEGVVCTCIAKWAG